MVIFLYTFTNKYIKTRRFKLPRV